MPTPACGNVTQDRLARQCTKGGRAVTACARCVDELENIAIGLLLQGRLDQSRATTTPAHEVIREFGFDELLDGLPGELSS